MSIYLFDMETSLSIHKLINTLGGYRYCFCIVKILCKYKMKEICQNYLATVKNQSHVSPCHYSKIAIQKNVGKAFPHPQ